MNNNQKKIASNIKREARDADYLMIWTDCDREGEYIGWEIWQEAKRGNRRIEGDQVYRAVFSHLERQHILNAARNPNRLDMKSVHAVGTRIEIDLRAGVTFTRLLTETRGINSKAKAPQARMAAEPAVARTTRKSCRMVRASFRHWGLSSTGLREYGTSYRRSSGTSSWW